MSKYDAPSDVIELLADLVRINSVNPNYADGVPEIECANFIEQYFLACGIEVWRQNVLPQRPNILARLPGQRSDRRIVFEAHIDTVSAEGMTIDPFEPVVQDGQLFGRGACDTKAGMAAMLQAISSLGRDKIPPPCEILFAATIDEEYSYRGVSALCNSHYNLQAVSSATRPLILGNPFAAQLAVVAEPTNLQLAVASKGVLRWKIQTLGKAAHSSKPHLGNNAIVAMTSVIEALQSDATRLQDHHHSLLGSPTLNIGVIAGGVQVNFVPDQCIIEVDRRLNPGETWQQVYDGYQQLMNDLMQLDSTLQIVMHPPMLTDLPLDCPVDSPVVRRLSAILAKQNLDGQPIGVPFGSDASKFAALGIPSVILGPGSIDQAHAAVEFVDCNQVRQAVDIYREIMLSDW